MDLDHLNRASINAWNLQKEHKVSAQTDNYNNFNYARVGNSASMQSLFFFFKHFSVKSLIV